MKIAKCPASILRLLVAVGMLGTGLATFGQTTNSAKIVLHEDGTKTESISDMAKGEMRESTYDSRGLLLSKRIVLLNEHGLPVQGVIYTGNDDLVGRVQFLYDKLGRLAEERSLNAQGEVFRRKFQLYDQSNKPLPPKIVDYASHAPQISSNRINFTTQPKGQGGVNTAPPSGPQEPKLPGQAQPVQSVSPRNKEKPEEKKRGLFDFLKKK